MKSIVISLIVGVMSVFAVVVSAEPSAQEGLERMLCYGFPPIDDFMEEEPVFVPQRYRDSLPAFKGFLGHFGWTTNQLIEGMICAITNNVKDENWADEEKRSVAIEAARQLSEINSPAVTNFFRQFNDSSDNNRLKCLTIPAMIWRTNLEPDVMAYMRSLCARTNIYRDAELSVVYDMFDTIETMREELKPAATNRVAKYMYYSIRHTIQDVADQDYELAGFVPPYSNSFQRISALQYVLSTTTNKWIRDAAQKELARLSAIPTNQLNNISWIAEDVNNGGN